MRRRVVDAFAPNVGIALRPGSGALDALPDCVRPSTQRAESPVNVSNQVGYESKPVKTSKEIIMARVASSQRSIVKAITYRILIMCMDFATIYLFTRKAGIAVGFVIASNIYTTVLYVVHERAWARVTWRLKET